ncbi:MAG TPA: hypothetical protein VHK90_15725, partial [Thermoanaerobaculia bacterium]|nr:hypothetical protein [Thermoanaerobaculia bacterium]
KLRVARRIAAAHVTPQSDVLDRLAFSESSAYARYPDVLANRLYIAVVAAILIYFLYSSMPFWKLLLGKDDEPLSGPWWTANVLALITCYVALLVWFTQWRIHRQADAMLGSEGPPIVPMRVLRLLRRTGSRAMAVAKRTPRTVVTLGATAIAISPFTMIATTCHNQPRTGADLLLNRNSAGWFTGGSLPESTLPYLGRGFYAATLLLAAVALMAVLLSLVARVSWTPIARALRPFAATAALFMLIELSFVFLAVVFPIMDAIRIAAVITPLVLWLRTRRRERWREVLRPRIEVCLLPAVLFALLTLGRLAAFGFTGLPVYFFGLVVLALPLLAPQEAEAELPAAVAPAYSSG